MRSTALLSISMVTGYVKHITRKILDEMGDTFLDRHGLSKEIETFCASDQIESLTFSEAEAFLGQDAENYSFFENQPVSLTRKGEERIYAHVGGPCWVTHYPQMAVPFYQAVDEDTGFALNADLLLGGRETVGAGQRQLKTEALLKAMQLRGNDHNKYEWYLRMKRQTPLQTCGFGMGVERYILWLTNHNDIRDIELFVRTAGSHGYA